MARDISNTYWSHNGLYESAAAQLNELIPTEGMVDNPRKNKQLERFRKASNCYYDLYNNGLCNRAAAFAKVFGIRSSDYRQRWHPYSRFSDNLYTATEDAMNEIIRQAAEEQGIDLVVNEKCVAAA